MKTASKIPTAGVPIRLVDRSFGRSLANGNLDRKRGIPQRPQRTSFGSKSSLWNQWKSAFLQRASEEAPTHRQPEFPRREHAHDVETQVGGAMRHFRSRFQWVWNLRLSLGHARPRQGDARYRVGTTQRTSSTGGGFGKRSSRVWPLAVGGRCGTG